MKPMSFLAVALAATFLAGCGPAPEGGSGTGAPKADDGKLQVAVMPKLVGIDYFNAVEAGAKDAAKDLGAELIYDGPNSADVSKQVEMIDAWIARGVDVIAVAPNDPVALSPALQKARERGIKVITFDADSAEDSRDYFVNQATAQGIGEALVDEMATQIGGAGEVAIITGSLTADNQNQWINFMKERMAAKYPEMKLVTVKPADEDPEKGTQVGTDLLKAYPQLKGIFGITSVSFPSAALAVKQAGKTGQVAVVGLSTPKSMVSYVEDGTVKTVILWNAKDLGYLTVEVAAALNKGEKLDGTFKAGKLGDKQVSGTMVILGEPMKFNKDNIKQFDF